MVGLEILIQIHSGKRQEFLQTAEWFQNRLAKSNEDACIDLTVFEAVGKPNHFLWIEKWIDPKSLETHMETDQFRSLLGAIEVLGELKKLEMVEFKIGPPERHPMNG